MAICIQTEFTTHKSRALANSVACTGKTSHEVQPSIVKGNPCPFDSTALQLQQYYITSAKAFGPRACSVPHYQLINIVTLVLLVKPGKPVLPNPPCIPPYPSGWRFVDASAATKRVCKASQLHHLQNFFHKMKPKRNKYKTATPPQIHYTFMDRI